MKKQKIKAWVKGLILIAIVFMIAGVLLYLYGKLQRKKDDPVNVAEVKETIDKYGYTLNNNVTKYYQDEFNILKEMSLKEDITDEEVAKQVAKLFIIDLYSIDYKINKYEVTSAQYYYSDKKNMFSQKVVDKLYNLVQDNAYDDRKQELPEVSEVEITDTKETKYNLGDNKVDAYEVEVSISYVKKMGYDTKGVVTLVKDSNNMSVVSYKGE